MDLGLTGTVALVLGGANGLGRAIAKEFATEGAIAIIADRDTSVVDVARELGSSTTGHCLDVTDFSAVSTIADTIFTQFGRCDHLVYAAGVGSGKFGFPFWNVAPADWPKVLQVNLIGAVNVAWAFAPRMKEAGSGSMLFIASVAGQIGSQTDPPYSASKAGLINFAQCAARDLATSGVRVNSLCPGMVKTTLNRAVYEAWAKGQPEGERMTYDAWADEKIRKIVPLGRWQEPEDIAAMAVFLASSRAGNITGQTINVDGGYVMHC